MFCNGLKFLSNCFIFEFSSKIYILCSIFEASDFITKYYYNAAFYMKPTFIEILSDNEEKEVNQSKQLEILQRQIEDEANLSGSRTGLLLAVNKQFIQGTPKEKDRRLTQRIKKMFLDKCKFDISKDHFCLKREPNYNRMDCQFITTQLLVFGTDFWPTKLIKSDAREICEIDVTKIDDSHTKIKFRSFLDLMKWLNFYVINQIVQKKVEEDGIQEMHETQVTVDNRNKLKGWFELKPYYYQNFQRKRQARFCTDEQKNLQQMISNTKLTNYEKFKEQIQQEVLRHETAKISYEMAEQRSRNMRKHPQSQIFRRENDKSRSYASNDRRSFNFGQRSRQKPKWRNRQRSNDSHPEHQKRYKKNEYFSKNQNKEMKYYEKPDYSKKVPSRPNLSSDKMHQSNILDALHNDSQDNVNNLSLLEERNNESINVITNAMNQMDLEDQNPDLDMSIEMMPDNSKSDSKSKGLNNLSIIIRQSEKKKEEEKKAKQKEIQNSQESQIFREKRTPMPPSKKEKMIEKKQRLANEAREHHSFDYLKYIEQCQMEEEERRDNQKYKGLQ